MASPLILAIDQSTSSTKALLVDETGRVVSRGVAPLTETQPRPGWVEQDPEELWQSVRRAVADSVTPAQAGRVAGVGIIASANPSCCGNAAPASPPGPC